MVGPFEPLSLLSYISLIADGLEPGSPLLLFSATYIACIAGRETSGSPIEVGFGRGAAARLRNKLRGRSKGGLRGISRRCGRPGERPMEVEIGRGIMKGYG